MSHPTRGTGAGRGAPKGNATGRGGSKASTPIPGARAASAPTIPPQQIASNSNLEIADTSHDDLYADPSGSAQPSNIPLPQGSPTAEDVARDKGKGREVETATPHSAGLSANTINSATLPAILKGREDSQSGVLQLEVQLKQIELELKKKRDLKKHFDNQIYDYQALRPGEYEKHMASLLGDNWRQLVPSVPPPRDDSPCALNRVTNPPDLHPLGRAEIRGNPEDDPYPDPPSGDPLPPQRIPQQDMTLLSTILMSSRPPQIILIIGMKSTIQMRIL
ncbi:hypothetical protein SISNIDRAFT_471903 [Sistotremastrum niveocremeum HHB9708]|uniref:Uncharacterized protein n=1 Tax=Sistotremastrum niveocremeum HHB9708 TaxID=1314777 RepID=A0A164M302_9AGAM|nr:hypothetical protein SISNIDRAFT_471903 [Sistotremastrum niveocremeum HHB9708]